MATPTPGSFQLRVVNDTPDFGSVMVEPATSGSQYLQGTMVVLRAIPSAGRRFERWSGDASGTASRVEVVMDGNKTVSALFSSSAYQVNADAFPRNGGAVTIEPFLVEYEYGTRVKLTANEASGFVFRGWSGDVTSTANPLTITVDGSKNITANFTTVRHNFITSVSPPGSGTVNPPTGTTDINTIVSLAATPFQGYVFAFWSGDATGMSNPTSVTMDRNKNIVANFIRAQYRLTVQAQPIVGGSISPSGGIFGHGQTVTVTAVPGQDYFFNGWSGDVSGSENPKTITMTKETLVIATFVQKKYPLTIEINPQIGGHISDGGPGEFVAGTVLEFTARPSVGYRFVGWTGDVTSSAPTITVVMDRPIFLRASFNLLPTPSPPRPPAK